MSPETGFCLFACLFCFISFVIAVLERRRSGRGARSPEMGCIFPSGCCYCMPNLSSYSIHMAQENGIDSSCKLVQRCERKEGTAETLKVAFYLSMDFVSRRRY